MEIVHQTSVMFWMLFPLLFLRLLPHMASPSPEPLSPGRRLLQACLMNCSRTLDTTIKTQLVSRLKQGNLEIDDGERRIVESGRCVCVRFRPSPPA